MKWLKILLLMGLGGVLVYVFLIWMIWYSLTTGG